MAESEVLQAEKRKEIGSRFARRLRKKGKIPAVVYGHKQETVAVTLPLDGLLRVLRHHARVIDLQTPELTEKVLIREVQWDFLGKEILHVDFTRVSVGERVQVEVPLTIRGEAPGVKEGGVLEQPMSELMVECPSTEVPESIRVNVNDLQMDGTIHVRDLVLPANVTAVSDGDTVVVQVRQGTEEPEPGTEEGEQAEPELIGRQRAEEEGEEG